MPDGSMPSMFMLGGGGAAAATTIAAAMAAFCNAATCCCCWRKEMRSCGLNWLLCGKWLADEDAGCVEVGGAPPLRAC